MTTNGNLVEALGDFRHGEEPLYQQLAAAITRAVLRSDLLPGTRLPPERKLAQALKLSRTTVVQAYARLREAGTIESRHGSGTWIRRAGKTALAQPAGARSVVGLSPQRRVPQPGRALGRRHQLRQRPAAAPTRGRRGGARRGPARRRAPRQERRLFPDGPTGVAPSHRRPLDPRRASHPRGAGPGDVRRPAGHQPDRRPAGGARRGGSHRGPDLHRRHRRAGVGRSARAHRAERRRRSRPRSSARR